MLVEFFRARCQKNVHVIVIVDSLPPSRWRITANGEWLRHSSLVVLDTWDQESLNHLAMGILQPLVSKEVPVIVSRLSKLCVELHKKMVET